MLSDNLKALLLKKNATQLELAKYVEVKPNTVSDWLNKGTSPKEIHLYRIAEFFGVSFDELFLGQFTDEDSKIFQYFRKLDDEDKLIIKGEIIKLYRANRLGSRINDSEFASEIAT